MKVISYVFRGRCGHELSAFVFVNSVAFNYSLLDYLFMFHVVVLSVVVQTSLSSFNRT